MAGWQERLEELSARYGFDARAGAALLALLRDDASAPTTVRDPAAAVLVEYAAPLLALGGTFVAWKGEAAPAEIRDGRAAAARLGLEVGEVVPVEPFPGVERRTLHLYSKASETPPGYPRRPGMARKR